MAGHDDVGRSGDLREGDSFNRHQRSRTEMGRRVQKRHIDYLSVT